MKSLQALLALFACAVLPLHAAGLDDLTWTTTGGEVTITTCARAASGELVIPDTIEGNPVTSIGESAFYCCSSLTSITIPDGVTSIGDYSFHDCASLTSITIPDSVTSIGAGSFFGCTGLTSFTIPEGVTSIGESAFRYTGLTSITIPDSVTSIGDQAFDRCFSLTSLVFTGSAPTVGSNAFRGVAEGAVALVTIEALSSFGDVGTYWNGLTLVCDGALCWLAWTTTGGNVIITDCNEAASGELVIPDTIEGNPVTSIGHSAFYGCISLTSITIPDSVTSIVFRAFRDCSSLTSIMIPDSVTSIGIEAFFNCSSLTTIEVGAGNVNYTDDNGVLFNKEKTTLHTYPAGKTGGSYNIPDSVTSIALQAFNGCSSLESITFGGSSLLDSIGDWAFLRCTSLTSITIPDGVTSIGWAAFEDCTSLTSVTIPDSITGIGTYAFYDCSNLTSITFQGVPPTVGADAFSTVAEGAVALVTIEALSSFGGIGADWNGLAVSLNLSASYLNELSAKVAELSQRPTAEQLATVEAERDARPTAEQLAAVEAERDARFTEDQIHALSADYTMGLNEAGNVEIKIFFIESADLQAFTPFTVDPESVSVVDGKICMEFPSEDRAFFFRFRVE